MGEIVPPLAYRKGIAGPELYPAAHDKANVKLRRPPGQCTLRCETAQTSIRPFLIMYLQARLGVVAALLAGVLGALGVMLASGHATPPSKAEMREALERELDRFVSFEMTMCGLVPRGDDRSGAISCAVESINMKAPFVVAFQERGEDSDIWSGLVGDTQGGLQFLVLESSPHGQPQVRAEYFVTSHQCREPVFADTGNGAVTCRSSQK